MRMASRELERAQEQAEERRWLLVSGRVRVAPEGTTLVSEQETRPEVAPQPESE
jgi:hypothetical protein